MSDAIDREPSASMPNEPERKAYQPPVLKTLGDVLSLTQAAYGGLNKNLYGYLFAQDSPPAVPDAPGR